MNVTLLTLFLVALLTDMSAGQSSIPPSLKRPAGPSGPTIPPAATPEEKEARCKELQFIASTLRIDPVWKPQPLSDRETAHIERLLEQLQCQPGAAYEGTYVITESPRPEDVNAVLVLKRMEKDAFLALHEKVKSEIDLRNKCGEAPLTPWQERGGVTRTQHFYSGTLDFPQFSHWNEGGTPLPKTFVLACGVNNELWGRWVLIGTSGIVSDGLNRGGDFRVDFRNADRMNVAWWAPPRLNGSWTLKKK